MHSGLTGALFMSAGLALATGSAAADLDASQTRLLAMELGATPDALTAIGFSLSSTQQALERLSQEDQTESALRSASAQTRSLRTTLSGLNSAARAATDTSELQQINSQISQAESELAVAMALSESARRQLIAALVGSTANLALAERVFAGGPLPAAYRVVELTDSEVTELRAALSAERHAQVRGLAPNSQTQQTLSSFRNVPAISFALGAQTAHFGAVQQLFLIVD